MRRLIASAILLGAFSITLAGCVPNETEKVQYDLQDAEIIQEQIDTVYGEDE